MPIAWDFPPCFSGPIVPIWPPSFPPFLFPLPRTECFPPKNPDLKLLMVAKSCAKRMPFHTIYNSWDKSSAGFRHGIHSRSLQRLDGPILPKTRSRFSDPGVGLVLNMMINNRRVYPQQFFQDINEVPPVNIFLYMMMIIFIIITICYYNNYIIYNNYHIYNYVYI